MRTSEILLTLAAVVIIIAGMKAADVILVPFFLSGFIAIISAPSMFWLERKGLASVLALLIVVLVIIGLGALITILVGQSFNDFLTDLPTYKSKLQEQMEAVLSWLAVWGLQTDTRAIAKAFDPGAAINLAASLLNGLGNMLTNAFLIVMTVIFMLLEAGSFPKKLKIIMNSPENQMPRWKHFLKDVNNYMAIKTWISLATGVLIGVYLWILGVDYAVLWGLLAFILNYIPNIGSIIAAVPAVLLALVQLGVARALMTAAGYLVVNVIMGNFIEPRFMGRGLGLSALVIFLSLLFWGWVLGPIGMLLSVPLTITAKIALDGRDETRWLAVLLGPEKGAQVETPVKKD